MKLKALDLFCGAGGASMGLYRAGFDVTGIDIVNQPRYPFTFIQADAMTFPLDGYDFIWASPPCQGYSRCQFTPGSRGKEYPRLLEGTRKRCELAHKSYGTQYVIENVDGAPLQTHLLLCGTMFGLPLRRHRIFEMSALLLSPGECRHNEHDFGVYAGKVTRLGTRAAAYVAGSGRTHYRPQLASRADGNSAMGIDWMTMKELAEAIPPAYSEYIGRELRTHPDLEIA